MNTIILKLNINEKIPVEARGLLYHTGIFDIQLFGIDFEAVISNLSEVTRPDYQYDIFRTEITIEGYAVDKKAKELSEAKEVVRKKQQEFKDAQRKLSELMGNTN